MSPEPAAPLLLSIIELGGYPDFKPLYQKAGFTVESVASVRKAISLLKTRKPDVIVAEFNFQSDFRDRTSSLESLLATVQRLPDAKVIVFYEKDFAHQLARLTTQLPVFATLAFPIATAQLEAALRGSG
jgi:DNA-binding NtrC family response regulator